MFLVGLIVENLFYLALRSAFYGVGAQQSLEILYSLLPPGQWQRYQKPISKIAALAFGAAWVAGTSAYRVAGLPPQGDEVLLAGFLTAASAELSNAIIKNLVYAKEVRKAAAADALSSAGSISLEIVSRK